MFTTPPTVYVETTVFSLLVARPSRIMLTAARQQSTRDWWQTDASVYELYASDIVRIEASLGDAAMAANSPSPTSR